jgi:isopentenyldiphosphate isomerase
LSEREIFDVVNSVDEVIGMATRAAAHASGLRHRSVHMLVFNAAGELYVQRRSFEKDCSPGLWDSSAAGHVATGENYRLAAERELHEELGLAQNTALTPLFKLDACQATDFEFTWVYRCVATATVVPDPVEIIEGRWCGVEHLAKWIDLAPTDFTTTFQSIWSRCVDNIGSRLAVE